MTSRAVVVAIGLGLFGWLAMSGTAAAHAEFESSTPADGSTAQKPLDEIVVVFSSSVEPTGEGFVVLDGSGTVRGPTAMMSSDGQSWSLGFAPPLTGAVGVRWNVKAPDAHPISGTFSFEVSAADDVAADPSPGTGSTDVGGPGSVDPGSEHELPEVSSDSADAAPSTLDEFLGANSSASGVDTVQDVARALVILGTIVSIGSLAFAGAVLQGSTAEVRGVIFWVRRGGLMVVVGAVLDLAGQVALESAGWGSALDVSDVGSVMFSSFGAATVLRSLGGWGLLRTLPTISMTTARSDPVVAIANRVPALVGALGEPPPSELSSPGIDGPEPPPPNAGRESTAGISTLTLHRRWLVPSHYWSRSHFMATLLSRDRAFSPLPPTSRTSRQAPPGWAASPCCVSSCGDDNVAVSHSADTSWLAGSRSSRRWLSWSPAWRESCSLSRSSTRSQSSGPPGGANCWSRRACWSSPPAQPAGTTTSSSSPHSAGTPTTKN